MSRKANKTLIGAFVVGAVILLAAAILIFGSGALFRKTIEYVLFFEDSVKGLSVGSPVIFKGVKVGHVKDISLVYDQDSGEMPIPVIIKVDTSRVKAAPARDGLECRPCGDYTLMVGQGLRARLVMQSFLTGELMVAFGFYPDRPAKFYGMLKRYPELPTIRSEDITKTLENILTGINKFVNSENVQETFLELRGTLQETRDAARSLRLLAAYLEEHPEALLRGKTIPRPLRHSRG